MTAVQALVLGVVQGLTEFLPVSSSGHLVLGKQLLRVTDDMPVTFEVVVHLGTLLATILVFWKSIVEILRVLLCTVGLGPSSRGTVRGCESEIQNPKSKIQNLWSDPAGRMFTLVVLGTIPAALVGGLFEDRIEAFFGNALLVGIALLATGCLLLATRWSRLRGEGIENVSAAKALFIGVAQAVAIVPGISRSGATIATALLGGVDRETAARFSFLLSIPAIIGAAALEARKIADASTTVGWLPLAAGFAGSFVVGYAALRVLLTFVRRGRLHWFAWYCWLIGAAAIAAVWLGRLHG